MKKICFILPNLEGGGAERVLLNIIKMIDGTKNDLHLIVFDQRGPLLQKVPEKVTFHHLKTKGTKKSFIPLMKVLRKFSFDVIFTTHSRVIFLLSVIKIFIPNFILIARMQNMPSLEKKYNEYSIATMMLYAFGFRRADKVLAQTEEMRLDGIKYFKISPKKISVLLNPIDLDELSENGKKVPSAFGADSFHAVACGRLAYQKGFDVLLTAVSSVVSNNSNFILHILGKDHGELEKLKQQVKDLKLEKNVIFHGYIANPASYYLHCDLFILSSRFEGFPNAMLENYCLNTPIVATRCVPIVNRLVFDGVNGYTCKVDCSASLAKAIENGAQISRNDISNEAYVNQDVRNMLNG